MSIYSGDEDCGDEITSPSEFELLPEPKCPLKATMVLPYWNCPAPIYVPCCLPLGHKGPCRAE